MANEEHVAKLKEGAPAWARRERYRWIPEALERGDVSLPDDEALITDLPAWLGACGAYGRHVLYRFDLTGGRPAGLLVALMK